MFHDSAPRDIPNVLDSLIARCAIEPVVAVFVEPRSGVNDHRAGVPLRTFLAVELPHWLESRYAVTRAPARRAVIGISYGAKDALDAGLNSFDGFERLGLLVPRRRIAAADVAAIPTFHGRRVTAAILAGAYDEANIATARHVRDALTAAGQAMKYTEVPEGHNPRTWLNHLSDVLVSLFPPESRPGSSETLRAAMLE